MLISTKLNITENNNSNIFTAKEIFIKAFFLFFFNNKGKSLKIKFFISLLLKIFF